MWISHQSWTGKCAMVSLLLLCRTSMAAHRVEEADSTTVSKSVAAAASFSLSYPTSSAFAYQSKSTESESLPPPLSSDAVSGTQEDVVQHSNLDLDALAEEGQDEFPPTKVEAAADKPSAPLPPVPQVTGCRTQGQIAVTFSEGPSDATAKMVHQLNNADARASFFVNATWLYTQQYAMVLQNTYNAGHFIGMTYRVKNDDSSVLTDAEIREDILNNARIIESLIHVAPKYVRLHYTQPEDTRTENILKDLGFVLVGYNLDSQDYLHKPIQDVYKNAFDKYKETYDAKGSFISVQYDVPGTVHVSSVPRLVNTINDEGYTMVRLDGCLNDPKPYKKSADSKEYVADKFSFNTTGYHQGQKPVPQSVIDASEQEDGVSTDKDQNTKSEAASIMRSIWCGSAIVLLGLAVTF